MNNIDYIVNGIRQGVGDVTQQVNSLFLNFMCWKQEKSAKGLSDFDKSQIVMARRLGQSISKHQALCDVPGMQLVSTYQKWCKDKR